MILLGSSTSLLLVNLLFAGIALAVGFAAGAWISQGDSESDTEGNDESDKEELQMQIDAERAALATDRLKDLAHGVASDVGAHSASIHAIEEQFNVLKASGATEEDIVDVFQQISSANEGLQDRLKKAEDQIKAQAKEIRTHETEARTDSLTQLANRRAFDDEIARRTAESNRHGTPYSLLILDVDHFKKFNDTHGHQAGDEVLRKVGEALTECARETDLACRYGGEEFAIVMSSTSGKDGGILAERVRKAIEALRIPYEGKNLKVTVSLGLAQFQSDKTPQDLIRRADEALYESKDAGRNCSHLHTGDVSVSITPGKPKEVAKKAAKEAAEAPSYAKLPNRTRFIEELRQTMREADDSGKPVSLMTTQLSGYEEIREEFGDAISRMMLDSVTQFLENAMGENNLLGRLEDGQFVVMMPDKNAAEASSTGDRISKALSNCHVPLGEKSLQLNILLAVSEMRPGDNPVSMMQNAESELQHIADEATLANA